MGDRPQAPDIDEELERVERLLRSFRLPVGVERDLQDGIQAALQKTGEPSRREHSLSAHDRIDFLLRWGVGLEVKVKGSVGEVGWQLLRYAKHSEIDGILLVTTRAHHLGLPRTIGDKPVRVYHLTNAF